MGPNESKMLAENTRLRQELARLKADKASRDAANKGSATPDVLDIDELIESSESKATDASHEVVDLSANDKDPIGESAGRRGGGGFLSTTGSFTLSSNRGGNSEAMLGERDGLADPAADPGRKARCKQVAEGSTPGDLDCSIPQKPDALWKT